MPDTSTEVEEPAGGAAKVPVAVIVWEAASFVEVKVSEPLELRLAVNWTPIGGVVQPSDSSAPVTLSR